MRTTIQTEEDTITAEVLSQRPDATRWDASTTEFDNGYFFDTQITVTTPAGDVEVDLDGTLAADALTDLSDLVGPLGQRTTRTVAIPAGWAPPPAPAHCITLHDDHARRFELEVDTLDADGLPSAGDLTASSGHLHIMIDGIDVGSLLFHRPAPGGPITVTLGAPNQDTGEWGAASTLQAPA